MKKLRNLILLWNLFNRRRVVTLDTIMQRCNVSSRTAYRYILDLSEANLPIYFDEEARGYRLSTNSQPLPTHLSADEFILVRLAAEILSRRLDGPYSQVISGLIGKLEATGPSTLSDLWPEGRSRFWASVEDQALDAFTNSLMLQAAIALNKDVFLVLADSDPDRPLYVRRPSLSFKEEWAVCSKESESMNPVPLSDIKQVLLEPERN
jgi:predicted DNA-binding transcriptional regulator YafY